MFCFLVARRGRKKKRKRGKANERFLFIVLRGSRGCRSQSLWGLSSPGSTGTHTHTLGAQLKRKRVHLPEFFGWKGTKRGRQEVGGVRVCASKAAGKKGEATRAIRLTRPVRLVAITSTPKKVSLKVFSQIASSNSFEFFLN